MPGAPIDRALVHRLDPDDADEVRQFMSIAAADAIVCANDWTAARLMRTLLDLGYGVPGDVRLVGIDDADFAAPAGAADDAAPADPGDRCRGVRDDARTRGAAATCRRATSSCTVKRGSRVEWEIRHAPASRAACNGATVLRARRARRATCSATCCACACHVSTCTCYVLDVLRATCSCHVLQARATRPANGTARSMPSRAAGDPCARHVTHVPHVARGTGATRSTQHVEHVAPSTLHVARDRVSPPSTPPRLPQPSTRRY